MLASDIAAPVSNHDADNDANMSEPQHGSADVPSAYPFVQPMKAAFHFDSVEGFGEWRILVSTRADRNLRDAKNRDQKLFGIILKKIKYQHALIPCHALTSDIQGAFERPFL